MKPRLVLALLVFACIGGWVLLPRFFPHHKSSQAGSLTQADLLQQLRSVSPWRDAGYERSDWLKLAETAREFQSAERPQVEGVLRMFMGGLPTDMSDLNAGYYEEPKALLLMRMMFAIPTNAPMASGFSFGGWVRFGTDMNPDRTVNLCWPVAWAKGHPCMAAPCRGVTGQRYNPVAEFLYLSTNYPPRDLKPLLGNK